MTKRRPRKTESPAYSLVDGVKVELPHSASIYVFGSPDEGTYLALQEERYEMLVGRGRDASEKWLAAELRRIAKSLAADLGEKFPYRPFLDMVARMLEPNSDYLKLVVVRRRGGKTWKRRNNDATLAKATMHYEQALGNKRGSRKAAVGAVADCYGVSEATVRSALLNFKRYLIAESRIAKTS
jgi:hypothetical protein